MCLTLKRRRNGNLFFTVLLGRYNVNGSPICQSLTKRAFGREREREGSLWIKFLVFCLIFYFNNILTGLVSSSSSLDKLHERVLFSFIL